MPLYFLMKLKHVQLPLRVNTPEEIRLVSVLKATGLIEAEIHALESIGRYIPSQAATVICITEEGTAKLDSWIGDRAPIRRRA
ncbi:hypothetical protein [Variovorax sp. 770b2]|uniref:hypothetical protein n=1 Tax=Variovorax sp. 770b2 TaxID=1566271 RepID=UPI0008EDC4FF|nr:hypothetical protein [Variovorax sp. 770b2]SFQ33456.1 hypothetical protein SAMN03159339_6795 [Variovorax sp. 770b2]